MQINFHASISRPVLAETIRNLVIAMAQHNLAWFRQQSVKPKLYSSGVRYEYTPDDAWLDYPSLLESGVGDCEDLVAARLAELWDQGVNALPFVEWQYPEGNWHITILHPNGKIEDVSKNVYA